MAITYPRHDLKSNDGGIFVYVRDDMKSCIIESENLPSSFEGLVIKLSSNLKHGFSSAPTTSQKQYEGTCTGTFVLHRSKYSETIIIGDYNTEITETSIPELYESYFLENVVKKPICFKNPAKPTYINLMIANKLGMFQNAKTYG